MRARVLVVALAAACSDAASPVAARIYLHPATVDVAPGGSVAVGVAVENASAVVVDGAPPSVSAVFDGHTLTIAADLGALAGTYPLSVSTPDHAATAQLALTVGVAASAFALSVDPAQLTVTQGGQGTATLHLTRAASFSGPVDISFPSVPGGVVAAPFTIAPGDTTGTLRVFSEPLVPLGSAGNVAIHGSSGAAVSDVALPVTIAPPSGGLDTTFGKGGVVIESAIVEGHGPINIAAAAVQADGKIVVVGDSNTVATSYNFLVLRYNPDGSVDPSFGTGGMVLTKLTSSPDFDVGTGVAIQPDGKIVVVGNHAYVDVAVVRYDGAGNLDPAFATGGIFMGASGTTYNTNGNGVAIAPDGSIVVAAISSGKQTLLRLTASGALDTTFGGSGILTGVTGSFSSVAVQPDGKVLAVGWDASDWNVLRRNTDGTPDSTFATGGEIVIDFQGGVDKAQSLLLQPDAKIVVGGSATSSSAPVLALARLTTSGALDATFGGGTGRSLPGGSGGQGGNPLLLQPDGKILIGGGSTYGGSASTLLVRVLPDGSIDPSFNGTGRAYTNVGGDGQWWRFLMRQTDGRIIGVGFATDPVDDVVMARYWP